MQQLIKLRKRAMQIDWVEIIKYNASHLPPLENSPDNETECNVYIHFSGKLMQILQEYDETKDLALLDKIKFLLRENNSLHF